MCDILRKRKACCKKDMDHSEGFSNLTVVANVLNNYLDNFIWITANTWTVFSFYNMKSIKKCNNIANEFIRS